ncbi:MAG: uracil-DNA glycosylase [Candidatus Marinimicrobia bacterium]|nr:uracil-DNA glycosylase [Candidatus Neomarinimicrobiota bacterium]
MKNTKKQKLTGNLNRHVRSCTNCRLSETRKHALIGEGDLDARLMLIALSPGENENRENQMFIGPSGQILESLLDSAGIAWNSIYMTNLIKCMLPNNRRPKMDEIETCSRYLDEEITIITPEVLVPLGYYATRYIFKKYHADPPPAREDYPKIYGKLIFQDDQKILPLPHPATLLHHPSFEEQTTKLYQKLSILSCNCKWYPVCPMKYFYEGDRLEKKWIELYCQGDWQNCVRYELEEHGKYHPDWMLPDGTINEKLNPNVNRRNQR